MTTAHRRHEMTGLQDLGHGVRGTAGQPDPAEDRKVRQIVSQMGHLVRSESVLGAELFQNRKLGQMARKAVHHLEGFSSLEGGRRIQPRYEGHGNIAFLQPLDGRPVPDIEGFRVPDLQPEMKGAVREDSVHVGADQADLAGASEKALHGESLANERGPVLNFTLAESFNRITIWLLRHSMKPPMTNPMIEEVSELFAALGDASRLKILRSLLEAGEPLSQGALAEAAGLSQANASKHLACLTRVGLVTREPQGNSVFFKPVLPLVEDICGLVCGHVSERVRSTYKALG